MKKDLTLVILAAGMGSRFGGLKQIEPVGPNDEFIIDYSIYDAIKVGFTKIVFIIKEENYEIFKNTIGRRIEKQIEVCYAFQRITDIPKEYKVPSERIKPWGTAHAIMEAEPYVNGNFAIINADDFYGYDALNVACEFLKTANDEKTSTYAMVGYNASNTLTKNGSVKRGICESKNGFLTKITESSVEKINDVIKVTPLSGSTTFNVKDNTLVSMNLFCFTPSIFKYLKQGFNSFLDNNINNIEKCEYLIPNVVFDTIIKKDSTVEVLRTESKWYGVTYKEDKEYVKQAINNMVRNNIYPKKLWK